MQTKYTCQSCLRPVLCSGFKMQVHISNKYFGSHHKIPIPIPFPICFELCSNSHSHLNIYSYSLQLILSTKQDKYNADVWWTEKRKMQTRDVRQWLRGPCQSWVSKCGKRFLQGPGSLRYDTLITVRSTNRTANSKILQNYLT